MEKVLDKLAKLIKHEQSARSIGNIHEAEAFANRIQILLTQNQLSMSDVDIETEATTEQVEKETINPRDIGQKLTGKRIEWQIRLLKGIAKVNNCSTLIVTGSNIQKIVGFVSDRQNVISVYSYFVQLAQDTCESQFRHHSMSPEYDQAMNYREGYPGEKRAYSREWKQSWLQGFATAISNRIYKTHQESIAAVQSETQGLIHLRNKQALVKEFMNNGKFGSVQPTRSGRNYSAYNKGHEVGSSVGLSGKVLN